MIASSGVSDVREVLDYYNQETDPLDTFKLNQVRLHVSQFESKNTNINFKIECYFYFKGDRIKTTNRD